MGFSLTFWWVIVDCCVILNLMLGKAHNENVQQNPCIVCRWVSTLHLLTAPLPLLVTHPFLEFFNPTTLQHFSISLIASKYFNLYKTLFWPYDEDYQRVAVVSTRQDKFLLEMGRKMGEGEGGGEFYNGRDGKLLKSFYMVGRGVLTPYYMKTYPLYCLSLLFFKFCILSNTAHFPVT